MKLRVDFGTIYPLPWLSFIIFNISNCVLNNYWIITSSPRSLERHLMPFSPSYGRENLWSVNSSMKEDTNHNWIKCNSIWHRLFFSLLTPLKLFLLSCWNTTTLSFVKEQQKCRLFCDLLNAIRLINQIHC